jgi:hypothetical protein
MNKIRYRITIEKIRGSGLERETLGTIYGDYGEQILERDNAQIGQMVREYIEGLNEEPETGTIERS